MNHTTKKVTLNTLAILLAIASFSTMLQAYSNNTNKNKSSMTKFTPDNVFGGVDAQGIYRKQGKKAKTATIIYDATIYEFNKVIEDPNPKLSKNKLNRVVLGFFSDHTNSKGMPVTTYIFGLPINDEAKKAAQMVQLIQPEKSENNNDTNNESLVDLQRFKPSTEFTGHDLIGMYDNSTHEAMINDPTGTNNKRYAFRNVQEGLRVINN
ncbi:MAG: hypothetical protein Q8Q60_02465, partial [Candidatus Chromulinivorax sp.]|nr:hypothetical protein [Candidatus Chromulinivorax sp.]